MQLKNFKTPRFYTIVRFKTVLPRIGTDLFEENDNETNHKLTE